jgi:pyruvate/2-oxoglutarate dehydrogenase complex dihydrolipoamide dehydrogenase (E3) component
VATINALLGARRTAEATIRWVTFTDPEVAHVGLTEVGARERWGSRTTIVRSDHADVDRPITEAEPEGFVLLVGDRKRRLVGATVIGAGAGEAVAELTARIEHGDKIDAISTTVHAYPTLAEAPARAADDLRRRRSDASIYRVAVRAVLTVRRRFSRA